MEVTTTRPNSARYRPLLTRTAALACAVLAACGGSGKHQTVSATSTSSVEAAASPTTLAPKLNVTFDDLGGGDSIIQVYSGIDGAPSDQVHNGTFNNGDTAPAVCKATGRMIHSHPELGEQNRQSDQWVRIIGSPGMTQYATVVYLKNPDSFLPQLPNC